MALSHFAHLLALITDAPTSDAPLQGGGNNSTSMEQVFTNGTTSGKIDRSCSENATIALGATLSLDVAGGGLKQPDGSPFTITKLKAIFVNKTGGTGTFRVERPAANGVPIFLAASDGTATFTTTGGGLLLYWPEGITVTAGTGDLISIVEVGGAAAVEVSYTLLGTSA